VLTLLGTLTTLHADPIRLRFAGIAPEGTAWAREVRAFSREIEAESHGQIVMRMYLGGIAGDDLEMGERIRRDQLDGALSAGMLCQQVSPSYSVFRVPGVLLDRAEVNYILSRLRTALRQEARQHGMVLLGEAALGIDAVATRTPVRNLAELRKLKLWQWDIDKVSVAYLRAMGLQVVPLPVGEALRAYEEGRIDGFVAIPSAVFGYQWFAHHLALSQAPMAPVAGCVVMSEAAFDRLPIPLQSVITTAAAKLGVRFTETTRSTDDALLGGVFARQGMRIVPVSSAFRADLFEASRVAREQLGSQVVPIELINRVQAYLADYRAERIRPPTR
jgi:TRAP-type C4-dicarboxylate transport system substrate-binding protein